MQRKSAALSLALILFASRVLMAGTGISIQAFTINSNIIIEMYNQAQQHNGQVTSYPDNMNPAVITATIKNASTSAVTPCFRMTVKQQSAPASCGASQTIVTSPLFTAKVALAAGETKVFTAADFTSSGNYQGLFCDAAKDQFKKDFGDVDKDNIGKVVEKLLKEQFLICLSEADCSSGTLDPSVQACSNFTIFTPNPGATESTAVLIYPHNNALPNCNINFLWTPGSKPGLTPADISYILDISEQMDGASFTSIEIPAGQTYYQYGAKDPVLTEGKQYYWRVIAQDATTKKKIGGQNGSGWNVQKWFRCGAAQEGSQACRYTLADLDALVQNRGTQEVKDALKGMKPVRLVTPDTFDDTDLCKVLSRQADLKAINVTKN